jgi:hypothetical protein
MTEHPCKDVVDFFNNPLRIEDARKFLNKYLAHHRLPPLAPLVDEPEAVRPALQADSVVCRARALACAPWPANPCLRTLASEPLPAHPCLRTLRCEAMRAQSLSDADVRIYKWRARLMLW